MYSLTMTTTDKHPAPQLIDITIGERLKHWRNVLGFTQEDLCQGMSARGFEFFQSTIHNIESGKRRVSIGEAVALAETLGVTLDILTNPEVTSAPWLVASLSYGARLDLAAIRKALEALTEARAAEVGMKTSMSAHKAETNQQHDFKGVKATPQEFFNPLIETGVKPAIELLEKLLKESTAVAKYVTP